jgi:pyridoxamine 5'-phosphate oxidase
MPFSPILRSLLTLGKGVLTGLPDASEFASPIELFGEWFREASRSGIILPEAMALATATDDGEPSVRMVLLKAFDESGFTFFTNYESRKAREVQSNPHVALVVHWALLQRQIRIEGVAEKISVDESDAYFASRPRGSQLGAWSSAQSSVLPDRATLVDRFREQKKRFQGRPVPRPEFWGGYRVRPTRIEFWQGRSDRLHDRLVFVRSEAGWNASRLYP